MSADAVQVDLVLAALGTDRAPAALHNLKRLGPGACDRLLAVVAGEVAVPVGVGATNGRAVAEDLSDAVTTAAMTWPERFTRLVGQSERLTGSSSVLWALGFVDTPASVHILTGALQRRQAGHQYARWAALNSLVRLRSAALPDLLVAALADRAANVRFTAVSAAAEFGDVRHLAGLRRIAARETESVGVRRLAREAIAAIGHRNPSGSRGPAVGA
jgi:hypothetical protein